PERITVTRSPISHMDRRSTFSERNSESIMEETTKHRITRRGMFQAGSAALAGVSALAIASAQDSAKQAFRSQDHHLPNEREPGPNNTALEAENPNSAWGPETDRGT